MVVPLRLSLARVASRLAVLLVPATILAQDTTTSAAFPYLTLTPLVTVGGLLDERARTRQLTDSTRPRPDYLLRSASTMTPPLGADRRTPRWAIIAPEISAIQNFALPYSLNDGALWAGRGTNLRVLAGVRAEWGPLRVVLAPELVYSSNKAYELAYPPTAAPVPPGRSPWANPWHAGPYPFSIDLPLRFGDRAISKIEPGQSSVAVRAWKLETGVATENYWWGPTVRNALVLSNNAPGFPHLFLRTAAPIETPIGAFSARWLAGVLEESDFFDSDPRNDTRSISMFGLAWQPWFERNLTFGATRAVYARADNRRDALGDFAQVFNDIGEPSEKPLFNPAIGPGRDQVLSLFARWVLPADGFETYVEWGRAQQPVSLHDFLVEPDHTQAYSIGLQWAGPELHMVGRYPRRGGQVGSFKVSPGRVRIRSEFASLEQATTFRLRTTGTWYTSDPVVQGYTNRGQSIGAAIGPGSSTQWLAVDYVADAWHAGISLERTRWQEDAHSLQIWPAGQGGWCEHDVTLLRGLNGSVRTRYGTFAGTWTSGRHFNVFFKYIGGCPPPNGYSVDVRQNTVAVTFLPAFRR
jgi:capsule assembly protein Wzi